MPTPEKNYQRLTETHEPMQTGQSWPTALEREVKDVTRFAKKHADKSGQQLTLALFQEALTDPQRINTIRRALGVPKTAIEGFVEDVQKGNLSPKEMKAAEKTLGIQYWDSGSTFKFDVNKFDDAQIDTFVHLLLHGRRDLKCLLQKYPFLQHCEANGFTKFCELTAHAKRIIVETTFRGCYMAEKGKSRETFYRSLLAEIGVDASEGWTDYKGKSWDIVVPDMLAVEVCYMDSTGSNQSNKANAMARDIEKDKGRHVFMFVGGGSGWTQRDTDTWKVCESFDHCYNASKEDAAKFLHAAAKVLKKRLTKREATAIVERLLKS